MALLQNLAEGFANAAGDQGTVNQIEKNKADRRATSHEELQAQTQSILDDVHQLQQRRASLDPQSPTYQKDLGEIDSNLHTARQTFTDLYHPEKNPDALSKLGGFLRDHALRRKGTPPATPGQAKESIQARMAGLDTAAAAPGQAPLSPEDRLLTPDQRSQAARVKAGIEPRATAPKAEAENWQTSNIKLADGREITVQHNTKSGEWANLDGTPVPKEQLSGAAVSPKGAAVKPIRSWVKRGGKTISVLVDPATNKIIPGSENASILPPSNMAGRITTGFYHFVDDDGNIHQVQETHTSMPAGAGGAGGTATPKTPGEAKDAVLGHKLTAPQSKAKNDVTEATKLSSIADQVAQNPNDAINQKRLAVALERASAGRFTTQALDYIIKAGWGNTLEQWANNPSTGALPADVMRQLVDGAHQNLKAAKDAFAGAMSPNAGGGGAAQPSGKAVSLAKAKQLPAMKGKSDDEIKKAIEASGHKVID